jgi:hypothetical protein
LVCLLFQGTEDLKTERKGFFSLLPWVVPPSQKMNGLDNRHWFLTDLESRNPRLRCWQVYFLLLADGCLLATACHGLSLCACLLGGSRYDQISSYMYISLTGLRSSHLISFDFYCLFKSPVSKFDPLQRCWGLGLQHMNLGDEARFSS